MPHLSGQITPWGPLINAVIAVSGPRSAALADAGQTVPPVVVARLVVDTGASLTAVDATILTQLGLTPSGQVDIHTPSTQGVAHKANQYDISLTLFGATNAALVYTVAALPVIDGNFKAQGIDGLLGRDVLMHGRMSYLGDGGWYGISF